MKDLEIKTNFLFKNKKIILSFILLIIVDITLTIYLNHVSASPFSGLKMILILDTVFCSFIYIYFSQPKREKVFNIILICIFLCLFINTFMDFLEIFYTKQISARILGEYILKIITIISCAICIIVARRKKLELHKVFAITAMIIGLVYMIIITPLSVPDEQTHYSLSYKLSNYILFQENKNTAQPEHFDFTYFHGHKNVPEAYHRFSDDLFLDETSDQGSYKINKSIAYPIERLPQTLGLSLGRILNLNFLGIFYLGRFFNLLFYVLILTLAIRKIPYFKAMIFIVGILPMSIQQAASFSTDSFINSMAIFLIANFVYSIIKSESIMTKREILTILIVSALLAPAKVIYVFIVFMGLLIPKERFRDNRNRIAFIGLLLLVSVGLILFIKGVAVVNIGTNSSTDNWAGERFYVLKDIISDPIGSIKIYIDTMVFRWEFYFLTSIGGLLSGLTLHISNFFVYCFALLLMMSALKQKHDNYVFTINKRIVLLIISGITIFLVMTAMLLGWTPRSYNIIEGVQGRYFIPVIPLIMMAFRNHIIVINKEIDKNLVVIAILLQYCVISSVINFTF